MALCDPMLLGSSRTTSRGAPELRQDYQMAYRGARCENFASQTGRIKTGPRYPTQQFLDGLTWVSQPRLNAAGLHFPSLASPVGAVPWPQSPSDISSHRSGGLSTRRSEFSLRR